MIFFLLIFSDRWINAKKSAIAQAVVSGAALGASGVAMGLALGGTIKACSAIGGIIGLAAGPVGAIIGGLLGAVLGGLMFTGALLYSQRRAKKRAQQNANAIVANGITVPTAAERSRSGFVAGSTSQSVFPTGDVNNNTENDPLLQKEPSKINNQPASENSYKIKEQFKFNLTSKVESTKEIVYKVDNNFERENIRAKISSDIIGSFSYGSNVSTYEEPSSGGSNLLYWKESTSATFIMTTKAQFLGVDENAENDDNHNIMVIVKLINCGHEFTMDYAKSGMEYRVKCLECGEESSVEFVKETGCKNGAQYKMIYT